MDNSNIASTESPKKINKILLFIFLAVFIITVVLGSYFLYTQKGVSNNNLIGFLRGNQSTNTGKQNDLFVFNTSIPQGKVGEQYSTAIQAAVYNQNIQITGKLGSELPKGLEFLGCQTKYDSSIIAPKAVKNSFVMCGIIGIPEQGGEFTVRVYFSIEGGAQNVYKDLPLVINP